MRRLHSTIARGALLAAGALALAAPGASAKVVHHVKVGSFVPFGGPPPAPFAPAELTNFYPEQTYVHVGDSIRFDSNGFHSVTFLPNGTPAPALFQQTGDTYGTVLDAAGNPFWFSNAGLHKYMVNPELFTPSASTTVDGSTLVGSGAGFRHFEATFAQVGTFKFYCVIHPHMTGLVHVVPDSQKIRPGQQVRAAKIEAQDTAAATTAFARVNARPSSSKVVAVAPGNRRFTLLQFFPSNVTAHVGDVVNFVWQGNDELHTVSFGDDAYVNQVARTFVGPDLIVDPRAAFPSEPGNPNPVDVSLTSHGNGFVNSGLTGDPGTSAFYFGGTPPAPDSKFRVRFTEPGTYHFECIVHAGLMEGAVTVTP